MNSKNLYFTIFSLILLGFISSCAENSNKCRPSYASNIEQLNEKLFLIPQHYSLTLFISA